MKQGYEYVYGSEARKLGYDVYEENKVLKAKKQYKNSRRAKLKLVVSALAIFIAGLALVYRFALITQISYNINLSEKQYYNLRNENSRIRAQVEKDTDLAGIKQLAETRLGMQTPDRSQLVYISVPKNDHTVVMNTKDENADENASLFATFINKVAGLFSLFG